MVMARCTLSIRLPTPWRSQVKGTFNVSMIGNITQSPERGEIYAAETFHTRAAGAIVSTY